MTNYFEQKQFFRSIIDLTNNTGKLKLKGTTEERKQTLKDNLIKPMNKTYQRKTLPKVTIINTVVDEEGELQLRSCHIFK